MKTENLKGKAKSMMVSKALGWLCEAATLLHPQQVFPARLPSPNIPATPKTKNKAKILSKNEAGAKLMVLLSINGALGVLCSCTCTPAHRRGRG